MSKIPRHDLEHYRGDFFQPIKITLKDKAGLPMPIESVKMQVKKAPTDLTPVAEFSTVNGLAVISGTDSNVLTISPTEASLNLPSATYVYDVEVKIMSAKTQTILRGTIQIHNDVTR